MYNFHDLLYIDWPEGASEAVTQNTRHSHSNNKYRWWFGKVPVLFRWNQSHNLYEFQFVTHSLKICISVFIGVQMDTMYRRWLVMSHEFLCVRIRSIFCQLRLQWVKLTQRVNKCAIDQCTAYYIYLLLLLRSLFAEYLLFEQITTSIFLDGSLFSCELRN